MKCEKKPNKKLGICIALFLVFFTTVHVNAQTAKISGSVVDDEGQPLIGANVVVVKTKEGTVTDEKGVFNLSNAAKGVQLEVSYVGYQAVLVKAAANIKVVLHSALLDEVFVTAQKRRENVQRIPVSVGVLTAKEISMTGNTSLSNVISNIPSVEVQGLAQGAQVYVRGVGSSIDPTFADPAVALMVDGVYNGRTESVTGGVYDLDRVEVLRGPQGTLYGRNASGGSINMITANPVFENKGYVRAQLGNYNLWKVEAMANAKLSDNMAIRVAGYKQKRDGYVDDGSYNADNYGERIKFLWNLSDKVTVLAKADFYRENGKGTNTLPVAGSAGNLTFPPPIFASNFDPTQPGPPFVGGAPIWRFPNGWQVADPGNPWSNNPEHAPGLIERKSDSYSLQIDADLGFANLTILPAYSNNYNRLVSSFLFGTLTGPYGDQPTTTKYTSLETRLTSKKDSESKLSYILGLYYLKSDGGNSELPGTSMSTTGQLISTTNFLQPSKTLAAFGQSTYAVSDKFRLNAGLRLSHDETAQNYQIAVDGVNSPLVSYSNNVDNFQYKFGFETDLAEKSMLYGHISTGFKQGGISPTVPPTEYKPEELTAIELGSKNRFLNDKMLLNVSIFNYKYKNYQFSSFQNRQVGTQNATADFIVIGNAGATDIKGLELESRTHVWKGGTFSAAYTYLDAKYGDAVLPNNPFVNQGEYNLGGTQIQNAPKNVFDLGFEQRFDVNAGGIYVGYNTHISSGYYTTPEQYLPGAYQDKYTKSNLSLRYARNNGKWSVSGWLQNLENKAQTTYVFPAYRRFVTSPRTFGVNIEYNF